MATLTSQLKLSSRAEYAHGSCLMYRLAEVTDEQQKKLTENKRKTMKIFLSVLINVEHDSNESIIVLLLGSLG